MNFSTRAMLLFAVLGLLGCQHAPPPPAPAVAAVDKPSADTPPAISAAAHDVAGAAGIIAEATASGQAAAAKLPVAEPQRPLILASLASIAAQVGVLWTVSADLDKVADKLDGDLKGVQAQLVAMQQAQVAQAEQAKRALEARDAASAKALADQAAKYEAEKADASSALSHAVRVGAYVCFGLAVVLLGIAIWLRSAAFGTLAAGALVLGTLALAMSALVAWVEAHALVIGLVIAGGGLIAAGIAAWRHWAQIKSATADAEASAEHISWLAWALQEIGLAHPAAVAAVKAELPAATALQVALATHEAAVVRAEAAPVLPPNPIPAASP